MNNSNMSPREKRDCPLLPDLLENQKLRHELERERARRKEAEGRNCVFSFIGFVLNVFHVGVLLLAAKYSDMSAETIEACAHLLGSCAVLLIVLDLTPFAVRETLRAYGKRKKEKDAIVKKEDDNV